MQFYTHNLNIETYAVTIHELLWDTLLSGWLSYI